MRRSIALVLMLGFALTLPVAPAFADDQAISQASAQFPALAGLDGAALVPMTDEQLVAVEGMARICIVCVNAARVRQTNASAFTVFSTQVNAAHVSQRIN
jgi:hypothetical protein